MKRPIAAIVLCAGKGTRMKSEHAKVLHPILGRPLCHYPLRRAIELGAELLVPVIGHQSETVEAAIRASLPGAPLTFALQKEQRGTADAVLAGRDALKGFHGEIFILYGDVPLVQTTTLKALLTRKRKLRAPVGFITTRLPDPTGYGRVVREGGKAIAIVEHKDATPEQLAIDEGNSGLYVVDSDFLWRGLGRIGSGNAQRERYLTDLISIAHREGHPVATLDAPHTEVAGVNDRVELARAARALQGRINEAHMRAGVTLEDPATTWIEESVRLAPDVSVAPGVSLQGATRVSKHVRIGQGAILIDAVVGEGSQVHPYTLLDSARVGRGAVIGPFARLRPGTELADEVHIGNFVETKKTRVAKGSKANHLAYLGDCEIGREVNVGAGTITCNYDGIHKHKTVLGDGVFVGSDCQFVAPVTVGAGALIGAGSCITEDVPAGSLAIARARQTIRRGYQRKKRAG